MKVIFDFDDVLFNASAFKELMFSFLERYGIKNAKEVYTRMRETEKVFSVARYIDFLGIKENEKEIIYEGIMTPCAFLVNKELVAIIEEVGKENIFIVSQGDEMFQRDKIDRALSGKVLEGNVVVVSDSKRAEVAKICQMFKDEEIIFTDDKLEFLNDLPVLELPNLKTVLFNHRGTETLCAEIIELRRIEKEKINKESQSGGPKMR